MIYLVKILFLIFPLLIISCDEEEPQLDCAGIEGGSASLDDCGLCTGGTTEFLANYKKDCAGECGGDAVVDDCGDCVDPVNFNAAHDECGVCNGHGAMSSCGCYGDNEYGCCDDEVPDCNGVCGGDGIVDECGECGGPANDYSGTDIGDGGTFPNGWCDCDGNALDCAGVCDGSNLLDSQNICCSASNIQHLTSGNPIGEELCLPELFKWSLTMTARIGEYENDIFIPSSDSASFVIGTHYLSTDGLDILDDMTYSDIVRPPLTVENPLSIYTSHPEWEYFAGNDFIQEYKFHDIDKLSYSNWGEISGGIQWIGNMTYDYWGTKFIQLTFTLNSDQIESMSSRIELSFNDEVLVYSAFDCEGEFIFSNNNDKIADPCNIVNESFEYVLPITFQGGDLQTFSILIGDTYLY